MLIRTRVFLIIVSITAALTVSSLFISLVFAEGQNLKTIENDMLLAASMADEAVSNKIDLLRAEAAAVSHALSAVPEADLGRALGDQVEAGGVFIAMAILSRSEGVIAAYGEASAGPELADSEYGRMALAGSTVISTTMYDSSGALVFYVVTGLGDRVLFLTLPGMFFSDYLSKFVIWKTGHVFLDDRDGTVLSNPRHEWVLGRYNFIEMAKTGKQYEDIAVVVRHMVRGERGVGKFSIAGIERICAFMPVSGSLMGWRLGVIAPISESPGAQMRNLFFMAGAIFFFLGILTAFFASSGVAKPFLQIQEQNLRLEELNEVARSASEAKSHFLANMSHEMRTPLNAVIGLSELSLGEEDVQEAVKDNLEKIYGSGMTLLGIVNDLLDISKIESGKFDLVSAEYDLPSMINDTINLNIIRIGSKPITFNLLVDGGLPSRLYGDELRIKQIFNNLLSNAFKYTKEGTVEWQLSYQEEDDTAWLTSVVRDTGMGIKAADMEKLFADYNRLDTEKNHSTEGTGLGLALTKRMAELMGGGVSVESEYGKGSAFTVKIKQRPVNAPSIGPEMAQNLRNFRYAVQKRHRNTALTRVDLSYARVLVVDDVPINLDVARGMMKPYGLKIDCALGGREAVEIIRKEAVRYDAVFMDHMMPEVDGIEAIRMIREDIGTEYARNIPVIVLTANALVGNEEMFLAHGFQDFLSKPIDIMRLDVVIHRWVRNKKKEKKWKEGHSEGSPASAVSPPPRGA